VETRGIDVFRIYQQVRDWQAVRASGVTYCWAKATNGTRIAFGNDAARTPAPADPTIEGARSAGIAPGVYGYALPGDPIAQADVLANEALRLRCVGPGTLPPALDLEEPGTKSADFAVRFLRRLQERTGQQRVAIYMSASWAAELRPDTWNVPGLIIWIASYGPNNGGRHPIPYYSGRTDVHQFTSVGLGLVRGITSSGLDVNDAEIPLHVLLGEEDDDMPITDDDVAKIARATVDQLWFRTPVAGPHGDNPGNVNDHVYWDNQNIWKIPGIADKIDAIGEVLAQLAERDDQVVLSPEQFEALRAQVGSSITDQLDDQLIDLAERLAGRDRAAIEQALREFYGRAVVTPTPVGDLVEQAT
jgi:GH25 family lysozyme M1 (1,4-beta-N-acetylmuramidase)